MRAHTTSASVSVADVIAVAASSMLRSVGYIHQKKKGLQGIWAREITIQASAHGVSSDSHDTHHPHNMRLEEARFIII